MINSVIQQPSPQNYSTWHTILFVLGLLDLPRDDYKCVTRTNLISLVKFQRWTLFILALFTIAVTIGDNKPLVNKHNELVDMVYSSMSIPVFTSILAVIIHLVASPLGLICLMTLVVLIRFWHAPTCQRLIRHRFECTQCVSVK
jgi:hypothetical protein